MLHHDNAAPHKAKIVTEYLQKERVEVLPHPPYSPDLAPCDFFLFPRIKKELKGKVFIRLNIWQGQFRQSLKESLKRIMKILSNVGGIGWNIA